MHSIIDLLMWVVFFLAKMRKSWRFFYFPRIDAIALHLFVPRNEYQTAQEYQLPSHLKFYVLSKQDYDSNRIENRHFTLYIETR